MNKEELLSFSLWAKYSEFLLSIKEVFGKELESQSNETINSFLESKFYDEDGGIKEVRTNDWPEYEVIYFKVENKVNFIDISFSFGITANLSVNFWSVDEKNGEEDEDVFYEYVCNLDELFLPNIINTAVYWIKTGELDDFGKSVAISI
jgi:hypothetical protein